MDSNCPECGLDLPVKMVWKHCPECGAPINRNTPEPPKTKTNPNAIDGTAIAICPVCDLDLPEGAATCPRCGVDLSNVAEIEAIRETEAMRARDIRAITALVDGMPLDQDAQRVAPAKEKPKVYDVLEHTFEDDEWDDDEDGREEAELLDDDDAELKKWLRAKIKRIAESTDPKTQYLIYHKWRELSLLRRGEVVEARIEELFVKRGYNKTYVRVFTSEGERTWAVDSIEIVRVEEVKNTEQSVVNIGIEHNIEPNKDMNAGFAIAIIIIFVLIRIMAC